MCIGRGVARESKPFNLNLGEPWAGKLADFCAAHYEAPWTSVIRYALDAFIDERLAAEPEVRKRYEAARAKRLSGADD